MDSFTLANFFYQKSLGSDQLQREMQAVVAEIKENEKLRAQIAAAEEKNLRLSMEAYTVGKLYTDWKQYRENLQLQHKTIATSFEVMVSMRDQLKAMDLNKILGHDAHEMHAKFEKDFNEMLELYEKENEMMESMENRYIVKTLRAEQKAYAAAEEELEQAKQNNIKIKQDWQQKINALVTKRNKLIVNLVQNAKEMEQLRQKQASKQGSPESPKHTLPVEPKNTTSPKRPLHLANIFKALGSEIKIPTLSNFFANNESEEEECQVEEIVERSTTPTSPRSILRTPSTPPLQTTPKRVRFSEHCSSDEEQSPTAKQMNKPCYVMTKQMETSTNAVQAEAVLQNEMEIIEVSSQTPTIEIEDSLETSNVHNLKEEDMSGYGISSAAKRDDDSSGDAEVRQLSEETAKVPAETRAMQLVNIASEKAADQQMEQAMDEKIEAVITKTPSKAPIEIKECRVVKPAGTPLPEVLPTNLSPSKPPIQIKECRVLKPAGAPLPEVLPTNLSPKEIASGDSTSSGESSTTAPSDEQLFKKPTNLKVKKTAKESNGDNSFDEILKSCCNEELTTMSLGSNGLENMFAASTDNGNGNGNREKDDVLQFNSMEGNYKFSIESSDEDLGSRLDTPFL